MSNRNALIYRDGSQSYYMSCFNGIDLREELTCLYQKPDMAYQLMLLTMQNVLGRCLNGNLPSMEDIGTEITATGKMETSRANYPPMKFSGLPMIVNWLNNVNYWSASDAYLYDYYSGDHFWQWHTWEFEDIGMNHRHGQKLAKRILGKNLKNGFVKLDPAVIGEYVMEDRRIYVEEWLEDPEFMKECEITEKELHSEVKRTANDLAEWEKQLKTSASLDTGSLLDYITEARKLSGIPESLEEAFKLSRDALT